MKGSVTMSTITRSISLDVNNARYVREKAARFKEAAETETRPAVAARLFKQVAFLEHEADFLEARARRFLDQYAGTNNAGFRDYVIAMMEENHEYETFL
jgi:cell division protein FtsB